MPAPIDPTEAGEFAPSASPPRQRRLLLGCFAASVALHALVLAALPVWFVEVNPPSVRVLEVVLVKPEPLSVAAPEPAAPARAEAPRQAPARPRPAAGKPRIADAAPPAPEAAPAPSPRAESLPETTALPAAVAPPAQPAVAAIGKAQAASPAATAGADGTIAPTPPLFNAAYLRNPPPRYPLAARRNGEQGTVTLRVLVDAEGRPASVSVEKTSGSPHLDSAALDTVRSWRFVPARQGERAVEAWVLVPIVFRLEGAS